MATVHLIRREGMDYAERVATPEGEIDDVYTVEVDDETLARWDAAEEAKRAARAAFDEAMKPVREARDEMDDLYDKAEDAYYASLPPRDPNAPPPGPIRDLFPSVSHGGLRVEFPGVIMSDGDTVTIKGPTINLTEP